MKWATIVGILCLMGGNAFAQQVTERKELSGKELFEHQWQPKPTSVDGDQDDRSQDNELHPEQQRFEQEQARLRREFGVERSRSGRLLLIEKAVQSGDGLGPLHNATSCAECHVHGGASGVDRNVTLITVDPRSEGLLTPKRSGPELLKIYPNLIGPRGTLSFQMVVHDRSTRDGYREIRNRIKQFVPGGIDDTWFVPEQRTGWSISKNPVLAGRSDGFDFYLSQRNAPPLFGLGDIESIQIPRLQTIATKQAEKTQGRITGRIAGKFGWRGQVSSLEEFVADACGGELGLNHRTASQPGDPVHPDYLNVGHDVSSAEIERLTQFVRSLPRPIERRIDRAALREGEKIFNAIGCVICHTPDVRPISSLFSDLLLHDMGDDLQAPFPAPIFFLSDVKTLKQVQFSVNGPNRGMGSFYGSSTGKNLPEPYPFAKPEVPQFPRGDRAQVEDHEKFDKSWDALQREWRTPPLWGVADSAPYLHDGRAATIEDAILWHGGEAQWSRDDYAKLPRPQQNLLLQFLSSLKAPEMVAEE